MSSTTGPTRSRYSLPKPEEGLAEWTSKIRAMQALVDADEEAEQKKLAEEIAASRLARNRRSRGVGYSGRPNSTDFASSTDSAPLFKDDIVDGPGNRDEALRKLTASQASPSISSRPEPMSLAAFMGGRATGPRLNKHAAQQDAHDPTQFAHPDRSAPHPVFGKGGVAMPGMARPLAGDYPSPKSHPPTVTSVIGERKTFFPSSGSSELKREQELSRAALVTTSPHFKTKVQEPSLPQATPYKDDPSVRPLFSKAESAARSTSPLPSVGSVRSSSSNSFTEQRDRRSSVSGTSSGQRTPRSVSPQKTGGRERTLSTPATSAKNSDSRSKSPANTNTAVQEDTGVSSSLRKIPVAVPSLARPVQPRSRAVSQGPQISPSAAPSPAFLKPPAQKDTTPSLSRLKGRGFVQNMVKKSQNLESVFPQSASSETPASRKASVLERWPEANKSPPSSPGSPKLPAPIRKSRTLDMPLTSPVASPPLLKQARSVTTASPSPTHNRLEAKSQKVPTGLGSATTLILMKPTTATSDNISHLLESDELGVKPTSVSPRTSAKKSVSPGAAPLASGKPLVHPTKDRARKPKKAKDVSMVHPSDPSPPPPNMAQPPNVPEGPEPVNTHVEEASDTSGPSIGSLANKWANRGLIDQKRTPPALNSPPDHKPSGVATRFALPGLVSESASPGTATSSPQEVKTVPNDWPPRIPSSGQRTTVMDVAQSFNDSLHHKDPAPESAPAPSSTLAPKSDIDPARPEPPQASPKPSNLRSPSISAMQAEKRKSSYEKYSSIILPPLKEEATPNPTPTNTLSRTVGQEIAKQSDAWTDPDVQLGLESTLADNVHLENVASPRNLRAPSIPARTFVRDVDSLTISVEVLIINGSGSVDNIEIFHDTEVLAIIHRSKSKSSGLASTKVWGWQGKHSIVDEKVERKLQDLARRYGTFPILVRQLSEPAEMVDCLGGKLAIRQGSRAHWSVENTSMHLVRSTAGVIFIDEHDLNVKNLCSAYSYCLSLLGSTYAWYGSGSIASERAAALAYAKSFSSDVVEMNEGVDDNDEMFWLVLGDNTYGKADYWRWRPSHSDVDPAAWEVLETQAQKKVALVDSFDNPASLYILDCIWEFFVIVGSRARGRRNDIKYAVSLAQTMAKETSPRRPFTPIVHVLVLPSQVPMELIQFRNLDEQVLNSNTVPEHMNLVHVDEALRQLHTTTWSRADLGDAMFLPVGVEPSSLSIP